MKYRKLGFLTIIPLLLTCSTNFQDQQKKRLSSETPLVKEENNVIPVIIPENSDFELALYKNPVTRIDVIDFYTTITGDAKVTHAIIHNAEKYNVPLSLAFSLAWAESRFNSKAVNHNPVTIDRGLFQLNSKSFPALSTADFFNPEINASYGLKHLKWCLQQGGNEIVALAIYNAGQLRVERGGTPRTTLDHINNIIDYKTRLEEKFSEWIHSRPSLEICMR